MKAYFLRKIPWNYRTVFFGLCASGTLSFPAALVLRALGYKALESDHLIGAFVVLLAFVEMLALPIASFLFNKIEKSLASLGILLFLTGFLSPGLMPVH